MNEISSLLNVWKERIEMYKKDANESARFHNSYGHGWDSASVAILKECVTELERLLLDL